MRKTKTLVAAAFTTAISTVGGVGCGIPLEEYDARVADLRKAEDRTKQCEGSIKQEQQKNLETTQGLEELRGQIRQMQGSRATDDDKAVLQRARMESQKSQQAQAERKSDKESLSRSLKDEVEAGVVVLDERKEIVRLVIPEEALFSSGSSSLGPPGKKVLDSVARELKAMPPRQVLVAAFVDRGPKSKPKDDLTLTLDRAKRVTDYLVKQGVEAERIAAAGFGAADAIADNANEEARTRNRRVEIELLGAVTLASPASSAPVADKKPSEPAPVARPAAPAPREAPAPVAREAPAPTPAPVRIPPAPVAPPPTSAGSVDDPGL